MHTQPIILSWSGGKDCLMALERLRQSREWDVVALLTTVNRQHDRIAMHGIRRAVLAQQAGALGLPLVTAEMDWPAGNDAYLTAWNHALAQAQASWPALHHCAFGDIALADVRAWREKQMTTAGWESLFPLWDEDTTSLAHHFVAAGHKAHLVCVDSSQLDAAFCGRAFDADLLAELPPGVDPCGENGEFHTLSWGGPAFAHDLALARGESVLRDGRFQFQDFRSASDSSSG